MLIAVSEAHSNQNYIHICMKYATSMYIFASSSSLLPYSCFSAALMLGLSCRRGGGAQSSSRPTPLAPSGRANQGGSVETLQSAGGTGVDTLNSSVQVTGDFAGSVPSSNLFQWRRTADAGRCSQARLEANLGTISANDSVRAARAERIQALSALLPNISANASETVTQVNLAAYGFQFKLLLRTPTFQFLPWWGRSAIRSCRARLSQSIYDPVQRRNWQASKETERAADAVRQRRARTGGAGGRRAHICRPLPPLRDVDSQRAQVDECAGCLPPGGDAQRSRDKRRKIDVMRSLVELQTQQQRLSSLEADLRKQKIALARVIGLPLDRELMLV